MVPLPGNVLPQSDLLLWQVRVGALLQETQPLAMLAKEHLLNLEYEVVNNVSFLAPLVNTMASR